MEIERKYLLDEVGYSDLLSKSTIIKKERLIQGYVYIDEQNEIRVRKITNYDVNCLPQYLITMKSGNSSLCREEMEFNIDEYTFNKLCPEVVINKIRTTIDHNNLIITIDSYDTNVIKQYITEIEFDTVEDANNFDVSIFFDAIEVTNENCYKNKNIWKKLREKYYQNLS